MRCLYCIPSIRVCLTLRHWNLSVSCASSGRCYLQLHCWHSTAGWVNVSQRGVAEVGSRDQLIVDSCITECAADTGFDT